MRMTFGCVSRSRCAAATNDDSDNRSTMRREAATCRQHDYMSIYLRHRCDRSHSLLHHVLVGRRSIFQARHRDANAFVTNAAVQALRGSASAAPHPFCCDGRRDLLRARAARPTAPDRPRVRCRMYASR